MTLKPRLLGAAGIITIYFGIRYVTQAGQGVSVPQNDGYAMFGAVLIFISGLIYGYLIRNSKEFKKGTRRRDLKQSSEQNLQELMNFANKHKNEKED